MKKIAHKRNRSRLRPAGIPSLNETSKGKTFFFHPFRLFLSGNIATGGVIKTISRKAISPLSSSLLHMYFPLTGFYGSTDFRRRKFFCITYPSAATIPLPDFPGIAGKRVLFNSF